MAQAPIADLRVILEQVPGSRTLVGDLGSIGGNPLSLFPANFWRSTDLSYHRAEDKQEERSLKANDTATLEVDLGDFGSKAFASLEELRAWHQEEKSFIGKLLPSRSNNSNNARNLLNTRWQNVDQELKRATQLIQQGQDWMAATQQASTLVRQLYTGDQAPPLSDSPEGKFLEDLSGEEPEAAVAALCLLLGVSVDSQHPSTYLGAAALGIFRHSLPADLRSHRQALSEIYQKGRKQIAAVKGLTMKFEKRVRELDNEAQGLLLKVREEHDELRQDHQKALDDSLTKSQEALTLHEETYSEKLALHASVEYWKGREKERGRQSRWTGAAFVAGLIVSAFFLWILTREFLVGDVTPQKVAALLLTASPIFWGLRVLSRLFLSYTHLGTDAAERHILIQTYLALHNEGKVKDEDRELLLATLFRPATTGMVADDAAPGWTDFYSKLSGK